MIINIVDMKPGETGTVTDIQGGTAMTARVQGMGIRAAIAVGGILNLVLKF